MVNVVETLYYQVRDNLDRTAIRWEAGSLNYRELIANVNQLSGCLTAAGAGQRNRQLRIGIMLPNGHAMAVALLACMRAGIAIPFNPSYSAHECARYFALTQLDMILVSERTEATILAVAREQKIAVVVLDEMSVLGADAVVSPKQVVPSFELNNTAVVLMTSGSTGSPKLVPLSHENLCAAAVNVATSMTLNENDAVLCMWEQHHVGGVVDLLLAPLFSRGTVGIAPGFDSKRFCECLNSWRPTWFQCVPTTLSDLLRYAEKSGFSLKNSSLRLVRSVAAPLSPEMHNRAENAFGIPVIQTFGMTEAGPLITSTSTLAAKRKAGSVGQSCGTDITVLDEAGRTVATGESGQIAIRGPSVFKGYENAPTENSEQFVNEWFLTGDIGFVDAEGDLFLTGRIKNLINRGGEKINPREIEDQLLSYSGVESAAAVAVPHDTLGEDVVVALSLEDNVTDCSEERLKTWLSRRLAAFKVPSKIYILEALPTTPVGKVDRPAVQALLKAKRSNAYVPPRNDLEAWLCKIWAEELDIDEVGVTDDFAFLGGDSLSSARILTAIEAEFAIELSDEDALHCATIEKMSQVLEGKSQLCAPDQSGQRVLPQRISQSHRLKPERAHMIDRALLKLNTLRSPQKFKMMSDELIRDQTPEFIKQVITRAQGIQRRAKSNEPDGHHLFNNPRLTRFLQELVVAQRAAQVDDNWRFERSNTGFAILRSDSGERTGHLLVCFTGRAQRLMVPLHIFLSALSGFGFNVLLFKDALRDHYQGGIPGLSTDLESTITRATQICASLKPRSVTAFGTSSGALPALIFAANAECASKCVAVGADDIDRHPHLLQAIRRRRFDRQNLRLAAYCSGDSERDMRGQASLSAHCPEVALQTVMGYSGHNLLNQLHIEGSLAHWLSRVLLS